MINGFKPELHPDYEMQTRVAFTLTGEPDAVEYTGRIIGVSHVHIAFTYIVLLDDPLPFESHKGHEAVPVWGTLIKRTL